MILRVDELAQFSFDRPILLRLEGAYLTLAFDHQPHGDRLHAPGAQAARHALVQQRRNLVAHNPIQNASRLLRIDQLHVDLTGMVEGGAYRVLRDFVELDTEKLGAVLLALQDLPQMPGNRLAFPIRIGRQVNLLGTLRGLLQFGDQCFPLGGDLVRGLELLLNLNTELALRQIPDVTHGGLHTEVRAQVLVDRLRFRGRFNDDQFFCHAFSSYDPKAALRTYCLPGSCLTSRFISSASNVAETHAVVKPLARMISSMATSSLPTCAITFSSVSLNCKAGLVPLPSNPASAASVAIFGSRYSNSLRISSTSSVNFAPSLINLFAPLDKIESARPGTANTCRPCSPAWFAVISAPLFRFASTTTTPSDQPLIMRFRIGKFWRSGCTPKGNSVTTAPPFCTISSANFLFSAG